MVFTVSNDAEKQIHEKFLRLWQEGHNEQLQQWQFLDFILDMYETRLRTTMAFLVLQDRIKEATESWKGTEVDEFMKEIRGYDEPENEIE
jgi:hypothetical protein